LPLHKKLAVDPILSEIDGTMPPGLHSHLHSRLPNAKLVPRSSSAYHGLNLLAPQQSTGGKLAGGVPMQVPGKQAPAQPAAGIEQPLVNIASCLGTNNYPVRNSPDSTDSKQEPTSVKKRICKFITQSNGSK